MNNRRVIASILFALLMASGSSVGSYLRPSTFLADQKTKISLPAIFPAEFSGWKLDPSIVPLQATPELQQMIEETYSETLSRTYVRADGERVMLSIAYGRNQHKGMNWHRPEVCYPAQGFPLTVSTTRTMFKYDDREIPLNRLVAGNQARVEPISYWLVVGDRLTNFGRGQKLVALEYGLRGLIPDGMLIRISTIGRDTTAGFAVQTTFINEMLAAMTPDSRQMVLGKRKPLVTGDVMPAS